MPNWVRAASNRRTAKAIGFEISQHVRNRLALVLVVFFIPTWIVLVEKLLPDQPIAYRSDVVGDVLMVPSNRLATISGAINAVTLIVGFMMFAAMRRSGDFDQRLVLAGYSRVSLLLAKLTALLLTSGLVALYATGVMTLLWDPRQWGPLALGLLVSALTYGGMGIVLALVLPTELAGMFMIIMISLVDVIVQNPVINQSADQGIVKFMPTYGAMQASAAAAFTDRAAIGYAVIGTLWLAGFALVSVIAFCVRTRDHAKHDPVPDTPTSIPAVVTVTTRADGSLEVRAVSGPVLLCSHLDNCPSARRATSTSLPTQPGPEVERIPVPDPWPQKTGVLSDDGANCS